MPPQRHNRIFNGNDNGNGRKNQSIFQFPRHNNNQRASQNNRNRNNHQYHNQNNTPGANQGNRTNANSRNVNQYRNHNQNNNRNRNLNKKRANNRNNSQVPNSNNWSGARNQSESYFIYDEKSNADFWQDIDNVIAGYEHFPESDEVDPWEFGSQKTIPCQFWQWSTDKVPTTLTDAPIWEFPYTGWGLKVDVDPRRPRPTRPGEARRFQKQLWREGWGPPPKLDAWYQRQWDDDSESVAKAKADGWGPPPRLDAWYERAYLDDVDQHPEQIVFKGWKPPVGWCGYQHQHCVTQEQDPDLLQSSVRIVTCAAPDHLPHKGFVPVNQAVAQKLFDTPIFNETNPPPTEHSHDTGLRYSPNRGFFQLKPSMRYDSNRGYFLEFDGQDCADKTGFGFARLVDDSVDRGSTLSTPPYQYLESDMDCGHDGFPDQWQEGRRLTICYYDEHGRPVPVDMEGDDAMTILKDLLNSN